MIRRCPHCGAFLDPGEICDCKENAAPRDANTESGEIKTTTASIAEIKENVK